jgi:hypothetical protein
MTRIPFALVLLVIFAGLSFAQTAVSDRCRVFVANVAGQKTSNAKLSNARELGTFDTVVGEEELTTRTYRLPNSNRNRVVVMKCRKGLRQ